MSYDSHHIVSLNLTKPNTSAPQHESRLSPFLMAWTMAANVPCVDESDDQILSDEILDLLEVGKQLIVVNRSSFSYCHLFFLQIMIFIPNRYRSIQRIVCVFHTSALTHWTRPFCHNLHSPKHRSQRSRRMAIRDPKRLVNMSNWSGNGTKSANVHCTRSWRCHPKWPN